MARKKNIDPKEILRLFNSGLNSVEIAKKLSVSATSVRYHYKKLNIKAQTRADAARKYSIRENYFAAIDTKEKAYILGLLYADGCNFVNGEQTKVVLELTDFSIIEKINNILQPDKKVRKIKHKVGKDSYRMEICCLKISQDLIRLGVIPRKSLNLKFPDIKECLVQHFIRGYFDGDGGVSRKGNSLSVNFVGNKQFLEQLQSILITKLAITKTKILQNTVSTAFNFAFSARQDIKNFSNWLYRDADLFVLRKKHKFDNWINSL